MQHKVITAGALNFKMATSHLINVCEDVIIAGALNFKMATSHLINVCEDVIIAGALISKWLPPISSMFVRK